MKKTLILISMVALSSVSMAQQGSWYIGGQVGFGSSTSEPTGGVETKSTSWAFGPEVGTFLKDDLALGIALGIGGGKTTIDGDDYSKSTSMNPTVYGRKFFEITENFKTFAGLYLSYISEKDEDLITDTQFTTTGFGARVGVGVAYAVSPKFTLVGQYGLLGFQSTTDKDDNGDEVNKDSSFAFGVNTIGGSVFNVGIYYTFKQP